VKHATPAALGGLSGLLDQIRTRGALRLSLGWSTTQDDVNTLLNAWNTVISSLLKKHANAA